MQPTHQQDADYRRLWPADRQVFLEHLMHLDVASRNDRFGGAISDAVIATYAKHSFHHDDVIYGAFVGDTLRAVGELRAITSNFALPEAGTAEAAFSVETAFRRRWRASCAQQQTGASNGCRFFACPTMPRCWHWRASTE